MDSIMHNEQSLSLRKKMRIQSPLSFKPTELTDAHGSFVI
jgi:hypothetical protein